MVVVGKKIFTWILANVNVLLIRFWQQLHHSLFFNSGKQEICSVELMSHIYEFLFVHHWFSFLFLRCSNCEIYGLPSMLPYSCFSSSLFFDSIQGMLVEGPPGPSGPAVSITFFPHSSHMEKPHRKKHVMENVSMELAWVFLCMLHYICMSFFQGLPGTPGIQGSPGLHGDPGDRVSWRFSENPP